MFEVNNGTAKINGKNGIYDKSSVTNPDTKYGRNAISNFYAYMEKPISEAVFTPAPILDFSYTPEAYDKNAEKIEKFTKDNDNYLNSLPPLEFELRYMPNINNGKINKNALFGAAYEDMGQRTKISVDELNSELAPNSDYSFAPIDINKDGNIDIGEYSTTLLAADMFSKSDIPDTNNIDGTINSKGANKIIQYNNISNAQAAVNLYSKLYNQYGLSDKIDI